MKFIYIMHDFKKSLVSCITIKISKIFSVKISAWSSYILGMCNKNKNMDTTWMLWGTQIWNKKILAFTSWINIKIFLKILVNN